MNGKALVLFAHGARDPKWAEPFLRLRQLVQDQMPDAAVTLAFLELMPPSLPDAVAELAGKGCKRVTVVPVFFGQGGHVLRDLPRIAAGLRTDYPGLHIDIAEAVGENPEVLNAIARYCIASAS